MADIDQLTDFMNCCYAAKSGLDKISKRTGVDTRFVLHWTAGSYTATYGDYHVNILGDGNLVITERDFTVTLPHTYMKNTGAIGLSMCCCAGATDKNKGKCPPKPVQIEVMAQLIAVASEALGLPIDKQHFPSHGEAADNEDYVVCYPEYTGYPNNAYGPKSTFERWDLLTLWTDESPYADPYDESIRGETILRGKGAWYRQLYYGH